MPRKSYSFGVDFGNVRVSKHRDVSSDDAMDALEYAMGWMKDRFEPIPRGAFYGEFRLSEDDLCNFNCRSQVREQPKPDHIMWKGKKIYIDPDNAKRDTQVIGLDRGGGGQGYDLIVVMYHQADGRIRQEGTFRFSKNKRPWCAKCCREVDALDVHTDYFNSVYIWTARCHGQTEQVKISHDETLYAAEAPLLGFTEAFRST